MLIRTLNNLCASRHLLFLAEIALLSIILACSNSQSIDDSASIEPPHESTFSSIAEDGNNTTSQITSSNIQDITISIKSKALKFTAITGDSTQSIAKQVSQAIQALFA